MSSLIAKPDAPSCARNRGPLLELLATRLGGWRSLLEIGSGTGQHAAWFAPQFPGLRWQCSDLATNLPGISAWLDESGAANTPAPIALDVITGPWPAERYDAVFSANTLHIMPWAAVQSLFQALPGVLNAGSELVVYGPFNYRGAYTSPSNAAFDQMLKQRAPHQGIRDFEAVNALAEQAGLMLAGDHAMPANNRCLIWKLS